MTRGDSQDRQESQDWREWHLGYADPASQMPARLAEVRAQIGAWLHRTAPRPVRVVSACAGEGLDLLGVLADRPDAARVSARLVEDDPVLAARAHRAAQDLDADVEVVVGDAGVSDTFLGAVPADLVLLCGVFGNIADADVARTIGAAPGLCAAGGHVVWTRGRHGTGRFTTDLTPTIRTWWAEAGFAEVSWTAPQDAHWSVGVHRLDRELTALVPGERWFAFDR